MMKKHLVTFLRAVVSIGLLAYLFRSIVEQQGADALGAAFRGINPGWFVLGILFNGFCCWFGVWRWQMILRAQGLDLKPARLTAIYFVGLFFNAFAIGTVGGDVIKAAYVAHETHHKKTEAVTTVVLDRLIGLLTLFAMALAGMAFYHERVFDDPRLRQYGFAMLALIAAASGVSVLAFSRGIAGRLPATAQKVVEAYRVCATHPGLVAKTALLSLGVHGANILTFVCVGLGLGITTAGLADYFVYLPIIISISSIPVTISGFGVREYLFTVLFAKTGMPAADAVALSVLGYLGKLFWSVVGAYFFLTHRKELPPLAEAAAA